MSGSFLEKYLIEVEGTNVRGGTRDTYRIKEFGEGVGESNVGDKSERNTTDSYLRRIPQKMSPE